MRKIAPFDRKANQVLSDAGVIAELQKKKHADKLKAALEVSYGLCGPDAFEGDVIRVLAESLAASTWCPDLLREYIGRRRDVPDVWYDWIAGYAVATYRGQV